MSSAYILAYRLLILYFEGKSTTFKFVSDVYLKVRFDVNAVGLFIVTPIELPEENTISDVVPFKLAVSVEPA